MKIWKCSGPLLLVALFAFGCTKPTHIGGDILPDNDKLNQFFTDTISVVSVTEPDDSLPTYSQSSYLAGTLDDPVFGKSFAGFYAQIRMPSSNVDLGEDLTLDSIVLTLKYNSLYGDPTEKHSMNVFRVTEDIYFAEPYRSDHTFRYNPVPLGSKMNFTPKASPVDSVEIYGKMTAPHLRIRLDDSFGEDLLSQSGTATLSTQKVFNDYLKGIFVAPDTGFGYSNAIMFFNLLDALSGITLYYKNAENDSLSSTFPINIYSAVANHFKHQYTNPDIVDEISGQVAFDSINYLQGMAGLRVKVKFPWLKNLGLISINHAELIITQAAHHSPDSVYLPPQIVIPRIVADSSLPAFQALLDEAWAQILGSYDFGGTMETETINGKKYKRYRINILRHLQLIIQDKTDDLEMVLKVIPSASSANRIAVGGGNHPNPDLKMKLQLTYTKLK